MNRGSAAPPAEAAEAAVASMRPRFMNRGSAEVGYETGLLEVALQ